jgi:nucleotidyltransferase/DNA polymerase involved in DNA repair
MVVENAVQHDGQALPARGLAGELQGVPKPVLRTVFGRSLGRRIWALTRKPRPARTRLEALGALKISGPDHNSRDSVHEGSVVGVKKATDLVNAEILRGMIEYLSRRAGEALSQNRRLARTVTLTFSFDDGSSEIGSARLARPTSDPVEVCEAVSDLSRNFASGDSALASISLSTSSIADESAVEVAPDLSCALAGAGS